MSLLLAKYFPNFTWILIVSIFNEKDHTVAGFKNDNDGNFMLVETPDNEKSQHAKYLLVNKENDIKSLIKIDSNKGNLYTLNMKNVNSVHLYLKLFHPVNCVLYCTLLPVSHHTYAISWGT